MKFWLSIAVTILACSLPENSQGQTIEKVSAEVLVDPSSHQHRLLESYVDGLVHAHMTEHDLPGMTVAVVVDHETAFTKGYGFADLETREAVDPERHLFRVGSISKTFVWVSVMQLADDGLIDLDHDINTYLPGFQIPEQFGAPITMRHLMTHTPGFEERSFAGQRVDSPDKLPSLAEYAASLPARVWPPGELYVYSSHATTLAGSIVEAVSGIPFSGYVEEKIFRPLGMQRSTFREALGADHPEAVDPALADDFAGSYRKLGGRYRPTPEYFRYHTAPQGGLKTTAADMAAYMKALLGDGAAGDGRILGPDTTEQLRERQFSNAPGVDGWTYGFHVGAIGKVQVLSHGGSTPDFYSMMQLAPVRGVGVFLSVNTRETRAPQGMARQIIEHVIGYEARPERLTASPGFAERGSRFEGKYLVTRRNVSRLESAARIGDEITVSVNDDGYLVTRGVVPTRAYVETGPLTFRAVDEERTLAFRENDSGNITYLFTASGAAYERIGLFRTGTFFYSFLLLSIILSLTTIGAAGLRRLSQHKEIQHGSKLVHLAPVLGAASTIAFAAVFIVATVGSQSVGLEYEFSWPNPAIVASQWIALVFAASVAALLTGLPSVWGLIGEPINWRLGRRLHYTVLALILVTLLALMVHWNMIGFKY